MDEARLIEKLLRIEALHAGATTPGEREAAGRARDRILERLRATAVVDPPVEYRFTLADMWSRRVFVALLRRYQLRPYRYARQRRTTVMVRVSRRFVDETLWPEYLQISESLQSWLSEVTDRVIAGALYGDVSEAEVVEEPSQLDLGLGAGAVRGHAAQGSTVDATAATHRAAAGGSAATASAGPVAAAMTRSARSAPAGAASMPTGSTGAAVTPGGASAGSSAPSRPAGSSSGPSAAVSPAAAGAGTGGGRAAAPAGTPSARASTATGRAAGGGSGQRKVKRKKVKRKHR